MNLKKLKIISTFLVLIFSTIFHNIYDIFPNTITSFLFPVNESIFEHMKLIYLSYIICFIVEYFIIKKYKITNKNLKASLVFNILFNIIILIAIYVPIYNNFGHNIISTISIYLLTIIITEILSYKILLSNKDFKFLNKYAYLFVIIILLILIYLTYYPVKSNIFIDKVNKKIGLNNYY